MGIYFSSVEVCSTCIFPLYLKIGILKTFCFSCCGVTFFLSVFFKLFLRWCGMDPSPHSRAQAAAAVNFVLLVVGQLFVGASLLILQRAGSAAAPPVRSTYVGLSGCNQLSMFRTCALCIAGENNPHHVSESAASGL
ncbi:unnamed protein product [Pylaiella littoralis]